MSRITHPGKFEGESFLTVYVNELTMNGDGEVYSGDDGGESYTFVDGPLDVDAMKAWRDDEGNALDFDDVLGGTAAGFCLHESSTGFVSLTRYGTQAAYETARQEVADSYSVDDDESDSFELLVGNVGSVSTFDDEDAAYAEFDVYVEISKTNNASRAFGEDVTLFRNGEIEREYIGHLGELDEFTQGYVDCALWASSMCSNPDCDKSLGDGDANVTDQNSHHKTIEHIAADTLQEMVSDCRSFQRDNAAGLEDSDLERAGHDFFLTRNHHGAGFWDGDYPDDIGRDLTNAAHAFGTFELELWDDGTIHHHN